MFKLLTDLLTSKRKVCMTLEDIGKDVDHQIDDKIMYTLIYILVSFENHSKRLKGLYSVLKLW